jgi:hypothetical protein
MWRQAAFLYLLTIVTTLASLLIALVLYSKNISPHMPTPLPNMSLSSLFGQMLSMQYSYGWANFLMYYAVFMVAAPFAIYALLTRAWLIVPAISTGLFVMTAWPSFRGAYTYFFIWQFYFFLGLCLARFRLPILGWFHNLSRQAARRLSAAVIFAGGLTVVLSALLTFKVQAVDEKIAQLNWLPGSIQGSLFYLSGHRAEINYWLQNNRTGLLRPVVTLLVLGAAYVLYQRYKNSLLKYTGWFVNTIGRNTLWVFVAQALAIPLISAVPIKQDSLAINLLANTVLLSLMWFVAIRTSIWASVKNLLAEAYLNYLVAKNLVWASFRERRTSF